MLLFARPGEKVLAECCQFCLNGQKVGGDTQRLGGDMVIGVAVGRKLGADGTGRM